MIIPHEYKLNHKTIELVQRIERQKTEFDLLPRHHRIDDKTVEKRLLNSAVFSARIEGIIDDSNDRSGKKELQNIVRAIKWIIGRRVSTIRESDVLKLHQMCLDGIASDAGKYRREQTAVFSQAGVAIYLTPPPSELPGLMSKWLDHASGDDGSVALIRAAVGHFGFEKIHPFLDGNGRVGRLLIHLSLKQAGFDLMGMIPFEEQIEQTREEYYHHLSQNKKDVTEFVEYFLTIMNAAFENVLKLKLVDEEIDRLEATLLPRRAEMLAMVRDHRLVSFDFIRRRFIQVNSRTLRYDLQKLAQMNLIRKRGQTKGARYEAV